jgi:hypothetical protein
MSKKVDVFSCGEKFGQSPIEKITKRLFEAQLIILFYLKHYLLFAKPRLIL